MGFSLLAGRGETPRRRLGGGDGDRGEKDVLSRAGPKLA